LTVLNTKRIQRTGKEPVMATTKDKDRQKKWKEKQKAHGKKSVTIMLDKYVKDLIDKERKRTGFSTASIIELAILNHLGLSSEQLEIIKQGRRPVPMETLQEIANGLLDFVSKIPLCQCE
jgi:predicted secreted protein